MNDELLRETAAALRADWGLERVGVMSEEALLELLAQRIVQILEQGPETFFQLMYRLDVSEKKLNAVMAGEHPAQEIALLVYNRQLDKIKSRVAFKQNKEKIDPDLEW